MTDLNDKVLKLYKAKRNGSEWQEERLLDGLERLSNEKTRRTHRHSKKTETNVDRQSTHRKKPGQIKECIDQKGNEDDEVEEDETSDTSSEESSDEESNEEHQSKGKGWNTSDSDLEKETEPFWFDGYDTNYSRIKPDTEKKRERPLQQVKRQKSKELKRLYENPIVKTAKSNTCQRNQRIISSRKRARKRPGR